MQNLTSLAFKIILAAGLLGTSSCAGSRKIVTPAGPTSFEARVVCTDGLLSNPNYEDCAELRNRLIEIYSSNSQMPPLTGEAAAAEVRELTQLLQVETLGSGSVKVMAQNVGTAAFHWRLKGGKIPILPGLQANCPNFKLCDPGVIRATIQLVSRIQPDVIFFSETQGEDQLVGKAHGGPILPSHYDAICTYGHEGVRETCVAWNTRRARLTDTCRSVIGIHSGILSCPLAVDGTTIQFVSSHPSAWLKLERAAVLQAQWAKLIDRSKPAIVGGDFNTKDGTLGFDERFPYPAEFGTLFGRHVGGYGRWATEPSFFGHFHSESDEPAKPQKHRTTVLTTRIDHIFANFGKRAPLRREDGACLGYSCLGGVDEGFEWWQEDYLRFGKTVGAKADHRPIVARVRW